jgi:hypothetical protein
MDERPRASRWMCEIHGGGGRIPVRSRRVGRKFTNLDRFKIVTVLKTVRLKIRKKKTNRERDGFEKRLRSRWF